MGLIELVDLIDLVDLADQIDLEVLIDLKDPVNHVKQLQKELNKDQKDSDWG